MGTRADVIINGHPFCVHHDGGDAEEIKAEIQSAIDRAREWGVKDEFIVNASMCIIHTNACEDYAWLVQGSPSHVDHKYRADIGDNGSLNFEEIPK